MKRNVGSTLGVMRCSRAVDDLCEMSLSLPETIWWRSLRSVLACACARVCAHLREAGGGERAEWEGVEKVVRSTLAVGAGYAFRSSG